VAARGGKASFQEKNALLVHWVAADPFQSRRRGSELLHPVFIEPKDFFKSGISKIDSSISPNWAQVIRAGAIWGIPDA
jgi:hypothetical protein